MARAGVRTWEWAETRQGSDPVESPLSCSLWDFSLEAMGTIRSAGFKGMKKSLVLRPEPRWGQSEDTVGSGMLEGLN